MNTPRGPGYKRLPLWRDASRFLLEVEQVVRGFSRYHKYTLGSDLRRQAMTVCRLVARAAQAHNAQERVPMVEKLVWQVTLAFVERSSLRCSGMSQGCGGKRSKLRSTRTSPIHRIKAHTTRLRLAGVAHVVVAENGWVRPRLKRREVRQVFIPCQPSIPLHTPSTGAVP